jgi:hypothetical protein
VIGLGSGEMNPRRRLSRERRLRSQRVNTETRSNGERAETIFCSVAPLLRCPRDQFCGATSRV